MSTLKIENLTIFFGGIKALNNVTFEVDKGAIYSIIGPNGAGKTTVFNCISGIYKPNSGKISFKGEDITYLKPNQVAEKGIARTFQNIELFSHMSTMDNLMLGRHLHMKTGVWGARRLFTRIRGQPKRRLKTDKRLKKLSTFSTSRSQETSLW